MRMTEQVTLGELLEVKIGDTTVRTKLQEIVSDTEYVVLQPTVKGVPLRAEDQDVSFTFYRPNGCYSFSAKMSPPFQKGNIVLCRVARISEVKRVQRRQCYRLPIVTDAFLYELDEEGVPSGKRCRGKTRDLSEKSVALTCFTGYAPGKMLKVEIMLPGAGKASFRAQVIRCDKPLKQTDPYELVLIFTDHKERDGAFLRRYIFRKQIQLRKNNPDSTQ